jgi:molybdate transport system ATP-binding protein
VSDPALSLRGFRAATGAFRLSIPALDVAPGEVFILLGRSGTGKTLLLETLAGFHPVEPGSSVRVFGREIAHLPPQVRRMGVIFQDYSLFPHLTVRGNILYGARHCRIPDAEARLAELTAMLGIADLLDRPATALSGGQKQRVGLARALILRPDVLLFDEPLAALDPGLRDRLRGELRTLLTDLRQTAVYITHDRSEAFALGDRVGLIEVGPGEGSLLQVGTPDDLFRRPADRRVAELVGMDNLLPATVTGRSADGRLTRVRAGAAELLSACEPPPGGVPHDGAAVTACLHSDCVFLDRGDAGPPDRENRLPGKVLRRVPLGAVTKVHLDCGCPLIATLTRGAAEELALARGDAVTATFRAGSVHLMSAGG